MLTESSPKGRRTVTFVDKLLFGIGVAWVAVLAASTSGLAQKPVMLDGYLLGYDLDMPDPPSVEQQIAAGKQQVEFLRQEDQTLDSQTDLVEYFNSIVAQLLKNHQPQPPFPILVHVSTVPIMNAEAMPGGQIVVFSNIFGLVDDEGGLVGILAHETSHQLHGDFLKLWHDYKTNKEVYGAGGFLEESQQFEQDADLSALKLMYEAGWDPERHVAAMEQLQKHTILERHGEQVHRSTHPLDPERIEADKKFIATFPPKANLIKDNPRFHELKEKY
jgi:predicted Zn-dependent protease